MALIINKPMIILGGIEIPSIYLRFKYDVYHDSKRIVIGVTKYLSREAYEQGKELGVTLDTVKNQYNFFDYSRENYGTDVLQWVHDRVKYELTTDETKIVIRTDPSTGNPVYDPSTNMPIYDEIIIRDRYFNEEDISYSDL